MTDLQDNTSLSAPLSSKWQMPLFILSLVLCGLSIWQYVARRPKPTWDSRFQQVVQVTRDVTNGDYRLPDVQARQLLQETPELQRADRGKLFDLLADIRWRSIQASGERSKQQWHTMLDYYRQAQEDGVEPVAEQHERMADAYADMGDTDKALGEYKLAWTQDPSRAAKLKREVIELRHLAGTLDKEQLLALLDDYLQIPGLNGPQYGWAFEQKLNVLIGGNKLTEAQGLIETELAKDLDANYRDQMLYQKARVLAKAGKAEQADDLLIELTGRIRPSEELYARANLLRGELIWQDNDREAMKAFQSVLSYAPGTTMATAARCDLGKVYVKMGMPEKAQEEFAHALEDLASQKQNPYLRVMDVCNALAAGREALLSENQPEAGLQFARLEHKARAQQLPPPPVQEDMNLWGTLAGAYLAVAEQAKNQAAQLPFEANETQLAKLADKRREHLKGAAEAFMKRAVIAAPVDDAIQGESLWMPADAFDNAGLRKQAIDAFRQFISGRPSDPRIPEARFRLGQALQSLGLYQEAVDAYQANRDLPGSGERHIKVIEGLIPMARCYIAMGEKNYDAAEKVLLSVIDDEDVVTPESDLYRDALFTLGRLHYLQKNWRAAIFRLGEAVQRDPGQPLAPNVPDPRNQRQRYLLATHSTYLMADCYYRLAMESGEQAAKEQNILRREEQRRAKVDQLTQAALTYQQVIERLENLPGTLSELDQAYRRNSYFAKGDCLYELGRDDPKRLPEALAQFENAVFLFQQHPCALGGLMQIYNCHMAMNNVAEARAANERASVLLQRMDPVAVRNQALAVNMGTWQQWLDSIDQLNPLLTRKDQP